MQLFLIYEYSILGVGSDGRRLWLPGCSRLSPEMRQRSTVGAVKVAVRSSSMGAGPSKS
ncbi:hypothetical protein CK203_100319 [Vitis vinifera]|uniref:Uncharacterized protein n=1 Tax=Vitis vinifera TaxID=29760 RepID=A0A438D735_VITVI|nr:hypothetical protein CK203_100319 [Vitis vinifera]